MGLIKARGNTFYYEEKGEGPPILLIPPAGATASTWGTLVDDLAGAGRVIAYDRRGYTRSGGEVVRSAAEHTRDAAAVLDALAPSPAVVVGTSAGATIALDLAVRRPDLVRAVVVHEAAWRALRHPDASGLGALARMQWLAWRGRYPEAAEALLRSVYSYRDGGSAWDAFPEAWRRTARDNGRSVVADLKSSMGGYPRGQDLATVTAPVVCTYGSRSRSYMRSITRSLAQAIPAAVREIDGAAHAVPFDAPGNFAQVIIEAMRSQRVPSSAFREAAYRRSPRQAQTLARAVRAGRARAKPGPGRDVAPVDGEALRDLVAAVAADARLVRVPVRRPPWTPTGLAVTAGEDVSWLAWGSPYLLRPLGAALRPRLVLRGRAGDGAPQEGSRDTLTFRADRTGELLLGSVYPGELQADGTITMDRIPYWAMSGTLTAVVARWAPGSDTQRALASIADRDPSGLCAAEAARLADPPAPPQGWDTHPLTGREQAFFRTGAGITVSASWTSAIIRHPAEMALTPSLRLRWSWRVDALPSLLPEDIALTHDYLSVALEFDDGQDLTWYWSCCLPAGFSYRCPLPHWRRRETHIVARSGTADLGHWIDEERPVLADHQAAIGGPAPSRVVRVWLIAQTVPQAGHAGGEFSRLELADGHQALRVLLSAHSMAYAAGGSAAAAGVV
ncbi:MAG: alpha/beta fold hydrolase [Micromonosporaceae bacterium]